MAPIRFFPPLFVFLWATGFIGARLGLPYAEPMSFLSLRFAIASCVLACAAVAFSAKWPTKRLILHSLIVGALIHGIYLGGVFWAIDRGMPAGVSALFVGMQPLLTALLAGVFLHETITGRHWYGVAIGLVGLVMVLWPKLNLGGSGINAATIFASLVSVLGATLGTMYQKRFATAADLRCSTSIQYLGAAVPVLLYALLFENFTFNWTGELIVALIWSIFVLSIGAIFLLLILIREGSVSKVSSFFYLVPGVAALIAWFWFDETLSVTQLAGMAVCALAVAITMNAAGSAPQAETENRASR